MMCEVVAAVRTAWPAGRAHHQPQHRMAEAAGAAVVATGKQVLDGVHTGGGEYGQRGSAVTVAGVARITAAAPCRFHQWQAWGAVGSRRCECQRLGEVAVQQGPPAPIRRVEQ